MKTNKKVQKNSVQKSEKENAVKVTALAIIPKPMTLLTPQDVPTATEEAPQQATFKTPLATATAEIDLDITAVYTQVRIITARRSMTHPCRNLRTAFGKWGLTNHCRTSTHGRRLRNHLRRTPLPCLTACRSKDNKGNHIRPYNRR